MHIRLFSVLETHKVIYNLQFGFQEGKSTNRSLIEITREVSKCNIESCVHALLKALFLLQSDNWGQNNTKILFAIIYFFRAGVIQFKEQNSPHSQQKNKVF